MQKMSATVITLKSNTINTIKANKRNRRCEFIHVLQSGIGRFCCYDDGKIDGRRTKGSRDSGKMNKTQTAI